MYSLQNQVHSSASRSDLSCPLATAAAEQPSSAELICAHCASSIRTASNAAHGLTQQPGAAGDAAASSSSGPRPPGPELGAVPPDIAAALDGDMGQRLSQLMAELAQSERLR